MLDGLCFTVFRKEALSLSDYKCTQKLSFLCKSIVGANASQMCPYSTSQLMPTTLHERCDPDKETSRFVPRKNKAPCFQNMVMYYFQRTRPGCKIESFYRTSRQKNGFCSQSNAVNEAKRSLNAFASVKYVRSFSLKKTFSVVKEKRKDTLSRG